MRVAVLAWQEYDRHCFRLLAKTGARLAVARLDGVDWFRLAGHIAGVFAYSRHPGCLSAQGFLPRCAGRARRSFRCRLVHGFRGGHLECRRQWRHALAGVEWSGHCRHWNRGDDPFTFLSGRASTPEQLHSRPATAGLLRIAVAPGRWLFAYGAQGLDDHSVGSRSEDGLLPGRGRRLARHGRVRLVLVDDSAHRRRQALS